MSGILISEDDESMRALLEEWLSEAGYGIFRDASLGHPDLVIIDLHTPRAGAETVRAAQAAHPGTPVIAISSRFRPGLAGSCAAAHALGAQRVIAKPFTHADLLDAVRALIGAAT